MAEPKATVRPGRVVITVDEVPRSPNGPRGLLRMHWAARKRYNESWTWAIRAAMAGNEPAIGELRSTVQIHQVRKKLMDTDNLYASCKPILDGLQRLGLIFSDAPGWCNLIVTQERGKKACTVIEVRQ